MKEKLRKAAIAAWVTGSLALTNGMQCYAEGLDDLTNGLTNGLGQIYKVLLAVALPVAGVALAACGVKIIWGNQKSTEDAKNTLVRILIALAIVFMAPIIIVSIKSWINPADNTAANQIFGSGYSAGG